MMHFQFSLQWGSEYWAFMNRIQDLIDVDLRLNLQWASEYWASEPDLEFKIQLASEHWDFKSRIQDLILDLLAAVSQALTQFTRLMSFDTVSYSDGLNAGL